MLTTSDVRGSVLTVPRHPAMSAAAEGTSNGTTGRPNVAYTVAFLNEDGTWINTKLVYASSDAEAISIAIFLADDDPFEVWQGLRFVL